MRILQLNKRYWPHLGGVERHLRDLASGLARRHREDVVALVCADTRIRSSHLVDGVEVESVPSLGTLWSQPLAPTYTAALSRLVPGASVVHLHEPFPLGTMSVLLQAAQLQRASVPLVVTWHSDVVRQRAVLPVYGVLLRRLLSQAAAVIVPTARHVTASQFLPAFAEKCHVIPFGIDVTRFQTHAAVQAGRRLRQHFGRRLVLFVGRLVYYKGLPYLIRAMQHVDATLLLVGEGRERHALERLAHECGVADRVRFLGAVPDDDLPAYYQACDAFVLPSTASSEGFGIVQLEAMASGRPVVSTSLDTGVSTVNVHGSTGMAVPPGDAAALAGALRVLLDDTDFAAACGRRASERVSGHYGLSHMVDATHRLYATLSK